MLQLQWIPGVFVRRIGYISEVEQFPVGVVQAVYRESPDSKILHAVDGVQEDSICQSSGQGLVKSAAVHVEVINVRGYDYG